MYSRSQLLGPRWLSNRSIRRGSGVRCWSCSCKSPQCGGEGQYHLATVSHCLPCPVKSTSLPQCGKMLSPPLLVALRDRGRGWPLNLPLPTRSSELEAMVVLLGGVVATFPLVANAQEDLRIINNKR